LWNWDTIHILSDVRSREHFNQIMNGLELDDKIRFGRLIQIRKDWKGFDYHQMIETTKIWLSSADEFAGASHFLRDNFSYRVGRVLFENSVRQLGKSIQHKLQETAKLGWKKASDVQKVLITWGTWQIPLVRQLISAEVGWEDKLVNLDPFSAVGKGLTLSWKKFL
jgi:molecular chaperone DnaK (HSP70)